MLIIELGILPSKTPPRLGTGTSEEYHFGTEAYSFLEVGDSALIPEHLNIDNIRVRLFRLKEQDIDISKEKIFSIQKDRNLNQYRIYRTA